MATTPQFDQLPKRIRELIMADMGTNGSAAGDATPFSFAMSPSAEVPRATLGPVFADDAARYTGTTGPLTITDVAGVAPPAQRRDAAVPQAPEQGALTRSARAEPDFQAMLNKHVPEDDSSSRYLAMAAAFSKPTVTGSFGETMSNVSNALYEQKQNQQKLRAQYAPLIMQQVAQQQAREELNAYRLEAQQQAQAAHAQAAALAQQGRMDLAAQNQASMDARAVADRALRETLAGNKAEPPAQIITTPEGVFERTRDGNLKALVNPANNKPLSGKTPNSGPMSATLQKELLESDDTVTSSKSVIGLLNQALTLNDTAYSGYGAKGRAVVRSNLPGESPEANATIDLDNIMTSQALESLKAIFGGMPTEGERKILLDMQASADKTPTQRKSIIDRAVKAAENRASFATQKAKSIRGGTYLTEGVGAVEALPPPGLLSADVLAAERARRNALKGQ